MVRKDDHTDVIPVETPTRLDPEHVPDAEEPETSPASSSQPTAGEVADSPAVEHPCPHCGAEMVDHDAPEGSPKHNAWHCDACGGCWVHRGSSWYSRAGHSPPHGWVE